MNNVDILLQKHHNDVKKLLNSIYGNSVFETGNIYYSDRTYSNPTVVKPSSVKAEDIAKTIAEINSIKNYNSKENKTMGVIHASNNPHSEIVDYSYTGTTYKTTTLTFRDGSKTSVSAPAEKADPYTGFYICFAKHMAGGKNKINNLAEYWIEKLPAKIKKLEEQEKKDKAEQARLEERDKKRREEKRVRMEAIRRKEQYEAAKLAHEKYGVPMDFKCKCDTSKE